MPRATSWTPEREARARQMWEAGFSASEIAERLGGVSRNGVISKMRRGGPSPSAQARVGGRVATRERDEEILGMLHLRDHCGQSYAGIARLTGKTPGAVRQACAAVDHAMADDTGAGNGSMPPRWWRIPAAAG